MVLAGQGFIVSVPVFLQGDADKCHASQRLVFFTAQECLQGSIHRQES